MSEKNVEVIPLARIEVGNEVHEPGGKPFKVTKEEADRLTRHVPPSVRLATDEDDEDGDDDNPPEVPLEKRSREYLDQVATALGVDKPGDLPNKPAVIKAIRAKQQGNPSLAD